ncbi:hypothetical protein CIRG_06440 [Coccidioides immitis RMSCC 2394]|uniref:DAGKc domain-containing protein n=1 Tax=Coccidioides immitis RMSCC 2394 TaxID=404692 RepID=A0A0J6YI49_COCIT|nr:hypothetical protein CIRG_06440 [Coccidioides immitis RMSCC 2394]
MSTFSHGSIDGRPVSFRLSEQSSSIDYEDLETKQTSSLPLNSVIATLPPVEGSDESTARILFLEHDNPNNLEVKLRCLEVSEIPGALWKSNQLVPPAHLALPADGDSNVHVVISTHSGTHAASLFFEHALKPLLSAISVTGYHVHKTQSTNSIIELSQAIFLPRAQAGTEQTIILLSGDGGLVDIIKVFSGVDENDSSHGKKFVPPRISLIPMGTGNATANSTGLFKDATWGLSTLLRGKPRMLPLFQANFSPGSAYLTDEGRRKEPLVSEFDRERSAAEVYGAVVLSWGMHASLVADSDTSHYRKFGAQRFQMAAKELLYPSDGSPTHQYCGRVTLIKKDPESGQAKEQVIDRECHMYVLATLVSQLEKGFTISPSSKPLDGQMHVVHFKPLSPDEAMGLMAKAYQGGQHVEDERVEYDAVERVRIQFNEDEETWRRVCVDGKVVTVEKGGWLEAKRSGRHLLDLMVPTLV